MTDVIQTLHDIEQNGGLSWPEDGKILVYIGCPLDAMPRQRRDGEALVDSFAEAEAWLRKRAKELHGKTIRSARSKEGSSILQRLFEADVPGSAYWVYDSSFGMTLRSREGAATSWAGAEAWFAKNAPSGLRD